VLTNTQDVDNVKTELGKQSQALGEVKSELERKVEAKVKAEIEKVMDTRFKA